ncbi:diguanylate cyclase [Pseudoalteromonas sp.]|uniref:diguanylate cyclase n=1 Tax=Pseudoalteromonas sp. TaxID=53249 RepID=UPI003566CDEC
MIFSFQNASFRDTETGLYNQAYFMEVFNREWHRLIRDKHSLSILLFNPHINLLNEADMSKLIQIGNLLTEQTLRSTDIICRFNKYCFAMGLFGLDIQGTHVIVKRIQDALLLKEKIGLLNCNISIGAVNVTPNINIEPESIFEKTITALHCAEESGVNGFQIESYAVH